MSCCAGKSQQANSTIPFRYGRLNYNHFQTGGITTESWSLSVWVQDAWEPHLIYILTIVLHKMAAQKADSATVILNSIATTDFLLDYSLSEWMISISSYTLFTRMVCSKVNQRVLKRRISSMDTAHPRGVASHPIHPPLDQSLWLRVEYWWTTLYTMHVSNPRTRNILSPLTLNFSCLPLLVSMD